MRATITIPGDRSVGIFEQTITIEGLSEIQDREETRKTLKDCFEAIEGEAVAVRFSDECPDCFKVRNGFCYNPNCISNSAQFVGD